MRNIDHAVSIVVGVTAHRSIRPQDRDALRGAVKQELEKLRALCPNSCLVLLCSLAEGGDQLCADAAEELGIPLIAVLPTQAEIYEKDFSPEALARFRHHCARAEQVLVTPCTEALPVDIDRRDYQFRQAGIYVSSHCHVLLALWDGGPGTAAACGTAEAVDFALRGSYRPLSGVCLRAGSNVEVIHIFTPRGEHTEEAAGTVHLLGDREAVLDILRKTDDLNALLPTAGTEFDSQLPEDAFDDPVLARMEGLGRAAGKLSMSYAESYRRVLALLAVASALLTFAFLMYDEAQATWMILVCGLMLLGAWLCQRYASRSDCHRRYLEFRALAECLRVQSFLRYAGSGIRTAELLSWTQQAETAWILDALCVMEIGRPPSGAHDIRECWVEDQRRYHESAGERSRRALESSGRIVSFAMILSIALYLAAVLFELLSGGLIFRPSVPVADVEFYRTLLKILLGSISAVTLFVANYYGRLSLPRTLSDHGKMERFYAAVSERLLRDGQSEELLEVLAREELIENGNWSSYQRDNKPELGI